MFLCLRQTSCRLNIRPAERHRIGITHVRLVVDGEVLEADQGVLRVHADEHVLAADAAAEILDVGAAAGPQIACTAFIAASGILSKLICAQHCNAWHAANVEGAACTKRVRASDAAGSRCRYD